MQHAPIDRVHAQSDRACMQYASIYACENWFASELVRAYHPSEASGEYLCDCADKLLRKPYSQLDAVVYANELSELMLLRAHVCMGPKPTVCCQGGPSSAGHSPSVAFGGPHAPKASCRTAGPEGRAWLRPEG